ncbi:MAG: hypothetical protein ACREQT_06795, partial [Candidatus Binataceae bacterium]
TPTITSTLAPATGLIAVDTTSIQNQINSQNTEITNLQTAVINEQNTLTTEYALLQAQIVLHQIAQAFLTAQASSSNSSSSGSGTTDAPIGSNLSVNG